jgi:hypothetical protein
MSTDRQTRVKPLHISPWPGQGNQILEPVAKSKSRHRAKAKNYFRVVPRRRVVAAAQRYTRLSSAAALTDR